MFSLSINLLILSHLLLQLNNLLQLPYLPGINLTLETVINPQTRSSNPDIISLISPILGLFQLTLKILYSFIQILLLNNVLLFDLKFLIIIIFDESFKDFKAIQIIDFFLIESFNFLKVSNKSNKNWVLILSVDGFVSLSLLEYQVIYLLLLRFDLSL